jgi:ribosomal protein S18 acetylase RimI-like enzyme
MSSFYISHVRSSADLEAVAQLFKAYANSLDIDLAYQDFASELASLPGKYAPPAGELLLARSNLGEPLGCVAIRPMDTPKHCEMKRLYVSPSGRGLGLGRALVRASIRQAVRIGYQAMYLDTLPSMVQALNLYRQEGFQPAAPYYDTPIRETIFLVRLLDGQDVPYDEPVSVRTCQ